MAELAQKEPYCPRQYIKNYSSKIKINSNCLVIEGNNYCSDTVVEEIWETNAKQESFLHFHTHYTKEMESYLIKKKAIVFFVKRDPRDQIISLLNHYKKIKFLDQEVEKISSDSERLMYMIRKKMRDSTRAFKGWLSSPICCVLDFNKLMGSHGGAATNEEAYSEMYKIASALDLNLSDEELQKVYTKNFGKGRAFFSGKVGSWRDNFSEQHKIAVKEEIGDLLIELGFEKDLNW